MAPRPLTRSMSSLFRTTHRIRLSQQTQRLLVNTASLRLMCSTGTEGVGLLCPVVAYPETTESGENSPSRVFRPLGLECWLTTLWLILVASLKLRLMNRLLIHHR